MLSESGGAPTCHRHPYRRPSRRTDIGERALHKVSSAVRFKRLHALADVDGKRDVNPSFDVFQVRRKTRKRRLKKSLRPRSAYGISKICSNKSKSTRSGTVLPVPKKTGCRKQKWTDTIDTIPIPGNYIGFRDSTNIIRTLSIVHAIIVNIVC